MGDAELLPFHDQTFDGVIATFVLEHSTDPQRLLSEVCRVVRRGGRIVLLGPSWDFPWWYPNSLRSQVGSSSLKRLKYTVKRFIGQIIEWLFGLLPFHTINDPDCLRNKEFVHDADAVYIVWAWGVVKFMNRLDESPWMPLNSLGSRRTPVGSSVVHSVPEAPSDEVALASVCREHITACL
jgi:SAM-dependent methyltransferase